MNPHVESVKDVSLHFSELIKDRLYFATLSDVNLKVFLKKSLSNVHHLFVDNEFVYQAFNQDFGPLNLGMLYLYCKKVNTLFKKKNTIIIHLTSTDKAKRVNAAFLLGCYCIIYHQQLPSEISKKLKELSTSYSTYKNFASFVHAGFDECRFLLHLEECFWAVYKAIKCNFLDFKTFNLKIYQFYEKVENGDLNWIVPGKFIAFCDPQTYSGNSSISIDFYLNYFREHNVSTIIRLNKSSYDAKRFTDKGFKHYDLIFLDGSAPNDYIMREFLRICESTSGAIAVHCKAGLGRTGTLIACYIMKHYRFTAPEATAWIRICRPGSIIGYQQKWLERKQNFLWGLGDLHYDNSLNSINGNVVKEDSENNNLEISIVKCRISTIDKEYINDLANANCANARIDKLINEFENIDFSEAMSNNNNHNNNNNNGRYLKNHDQSFTQGDYLNEIKLNRKKTTSNHKGTCRHKPSSCSSQVPNALRLDPNNNFSFAEHAASPSSRVQNDNNSLKLYGKKMIKYPSVISKVLPH